MPHSLRRPRSRSPGGIRVVAAALLLTGSVFASAGGAAGDSPGTSPQPTTQRYEIVNGHARYAASADDAGELLGHLDLVLLGLVLQSDAQSSQPLFSVGDFRLAQGESTLETRRPLTHQGLAPLPDVYGFPTLLRVLPSAGGPWTLAAGGDVAGGSDDGQQVSFRMIDIDLEFAAMTGEPTGAGHPGELAARGAIREHLRTYRINRDLPCPSPFDPPGVILLGNTAIRIPPGSATLSMVQGSSAIEIAGLPSVDAAASRSIAAASNAPRYGVAEALKRSQSSASDHAESEAGDLVALLTEQLGLEAESFEVSVSADAGTWTVASPGDLLIRGGSVAIDGLTHLVLQAHGTIRISGNLSLPPGSALTIEAGGAVIADDDVAIVIPPISTGICAALEFVAETEPVTVAEIAFTALALREVSIDVRPGRAPNHLHPFSRGLLPVAILGSEDFDVRDLQVSALRLGPGGVRPTHSRAARPFDLDDDGHDDLIVRFPIAGSGVALGDTELCLRGRTALRAFEGCDAIETRHPRRRPVRRRWTF